MSNGILTDLQVILGRDIDPQTLAIDHRSCSRKKDTNGTESLVHRCLLLVWFIRCTGSARLSHYLWHAPNTAEVWGQFVRQCQFGVTTLSFVLMGDKKVDRRFPCWPFGKWKTHGVDLSAPWTNLKQIQAVYTSENYHASPENHPEMKRNIIWTKPPWLLGSKCSSFQRVSRSLPLPIIGCRKFSNLNLWGRLPNIRGLTAAQIP